MGLFESKETKTNKLIEKYGLENLSQSDIDCISSFAENYKKAVSFSTTSISTAKPHEINTMFAQLTIMEQNFLIIKQLDQLNKNIEKFINK